MLTTIQFNNENDNGIVTHLVNKYQNVPRFSTNEAKPETNPKTMYISSSYLLFDVDQNPAILYFDFLKLRMSITDYKLSVIKGSTPPAQWEIAGRNKDNEEWSVIHLSDVDTYICPEGTPPLVKSQCDSDVTKQYHLNKSIGPYRYIRYSVLHQRSAYGEIVDNGFMRLRKLDFFGSIWISSFQFYQKSKRNNNIIFLLINLISQ